MMRRLLGLILAGLLISGAAVAQTPEAAGPHQHKVVVFFGSWSAEIDDTAKAALDEAASWSKDHPNAVVRVAGYASTVGSRRANVLLADLRAQVVVDGLIERGVAAGKIRQTGHGPNAFVDTPLESRRVEISVSSR